MSARILSLLLGLAVLTLAFFYYETLQSFGFPDGHKTELERALIPLYGWFAGLSVCCGVYLLYLGGYGNVGRREWKLRAVVVLYSLLFAALLAANYYFSLGLDAGVGG